MTTWSKVKGRFSGRQGIVLSSGLISATEINLVRRLSFERDYVVLAYKTVLNQLDFNPHVLILDPRLKNTRPMSSNDFETLVIYNDEGLGIKFESLPRSEDFHVHLYIESSGPRLTMENSSILSNDGNVLHTTRSTNPSEKALVVLQHLGISDITLFGFSFLDDKVSDDTLWNPIVTTTCHWQTVEPGHLLNSYASHFWIHFAEATGIRLRVHGERGSVCRRLPRVSFTRDLEQKEIATQGGPCGCLCGYLQETMDLPFYSSVSGLDRPLAKEAHEHFMQLGFFLGLPLRQEAPMDIDMRMHYQEIRWYLERTTAGMKALLDAVLFSYLHHVLFPHGRHTCRLKYLPLDAQDVHVLERKFSLSSVDYHQCGHEAEKAALERFKQSAAHEAELTKLIPTLIRVVRWQDHEVPLDFDWRTYRSMHEDLQHALPHHQMCLEEHYSIHGYEEGRAYSHGGQRERFVAIVPLKHHSSRVPGKNCRDLGGRPLYAHILDTLLQCQCVGLVVVDTDSDEMHEAILHRYMGERILVHPREEQLLGDDTSVHRIILSVHAWLRALRPRFPPNLYLQTHATNPFLQAATLDRAAATFLEDRSRSLMSVLRHQARFYFGDSARPINHDPEELMQTQDLPPIFEDCSSFYFFSAETLKEFSRRTCSAPRFYELGRIEAHDIDWEEDFLVAQSFIKTMQ